MRQKDEQSTALVLPSTPVRTIQVSKPLSDDAQRAVDVLKRVGRSPATIRAYIDDWRCFTEWCSRESQSPFPVEEDTIIAFLASFGLDAKPATLKRRVATIRTMHREWGDPLPRLFGVENALENITRKRVQEGLSNETKKRGLTPREVIKASMALPKTLLGLRDRAILLFGTAVGQRGADIAALRVQDVEWIDGGVRVVIRKSKTDQLGKTNRFLVARAVNPLGCPVGALDAWLRAAEVREGALLRRIHRSGVVDRRPIGTHIIARVAKDAAKVLGYDPREYGGHSLRAGFVTALHTAKIPAARGMKVTGHTKHETYAGYDRDSERVEDAVTFGLFEADEVEVETTVAPRETTEAFGQTLVKAPKRRFEKDGKPYNARAAIEALKAKGVPEEKIAEALRGLGVTWAGRPVEARDL